MEQRLAVLTWIIERSQAFSEVESQSFPDMITAFNAEHRMLGRRSVVNDIIGIHRKVRPLVYDRVRTRGSRVALQVDGWTSEA